MTRDKLIERGKVDRKFLRNLRMINQMPVSRGRLIRWRFKLIADRGAKRNFITFADC